MTTLKELIDLAIQTKNRAYCPYSNFQVGSAILSSAGGVFSGCNWEVANYGGTICAERCAISQMIAAGQYEISVCVISANCTKGEFAAPCGHCRQALREFSPEDRTQLKIYLVNAEREIKETNIEELLPMSFGPDSLGLGRPNEFYAKNAQTNGCGDLKPVNGCDKSNGYANGHANGNGAVASGS